MQDQRLHLDFDLKIFSYPLKMQDQVHCERGICFGEERLILEEK